MECLVPDFGKYDEINKMYVVRGWGVFFEVKQFAEYETQKIFVILHLTCVFKKYQVYIKKYDGRMVETILPPYCNLL